MSTKTYVLMMVLAVAGCDDTTTAMDDSAPSGGKFDDADTATDQSERSTILLPLPEIESVRATLRGLVSSAAGSPQTLSARGDVYGLTRADCADIEAIYGDQGRQLCEDGALGVPVTAADRLPTLSEGEAELSARGDGDAGELPMLLVDLQAGVLLQPTLIAADGQRTEVVDAVRRVSLGPQSVTVWARDPGGAGGATVSGQLDLAAADLAVIVLPDPTPYAAPGSYAGYDFELDLECLSATCSFERGE